MSACAATCGPPTWLWGGFSGETAILGEGRTGQVTPILDPGSSEVSVLAASTVRDGAFRVCAVDGRNRTQRFFGEVTAVRSDVAPLDVEPAPMGDARS